MPKSGSTIKSRRIDSRNDRDPRTIWNSARNDLVFAMIMDEDSYCSQSVRAETLPEARTPYIVNA